MPDDMNSKRVMIQEIVDFFSLEQLTGNEQSLNRWVVIPDVNRPGFELSGYFKPTEPRRVVIIGNKEIEYIGHLSDDEQRARFPSITDGLTPMLIITKNNEIPPILKEVAMERNFPVFRTRNDTYRMMVDLITFLDERLAPEETLSGDLMVVYGKGVLITGESGMGKSEIAMELVRDGQVLVADDRVDVQKIHNSLYGHAPELLRGMLEIRGIGIIDVERMFGANNLSPRSRIDLVIHLVKYDASEEYERIGDEMTAYTNIMGVNIPAMSLPVSPGRSMRALIETAVSNFILKEEGYNSTEEFKERLHEMLRKVSEGIAEG
ncbi:MAG: HPr(Ser) kinase/phosphatase [Solobacterium sp.]|nr:HPr(Ser) kinase/phosphatase [Solobacterium sp.]MBR2794244.1 HPr(Ser) kinase/phosphatase [Solobacterium sp.]